MIKMTGYYRSSLIKFEDFQAGNDLTRYKYIYLIFFNNGKVLRFISESDSIGKAQISYLVDKTESIYDIENNSSLVLNLLPNVSSVKPVKLDIISPNILSSENYGDYHYHPWPEE